MFHSILLVTLNQILTTLNSILAALSLFLATFSAYKLYVFYYLKVNLLSFISTLRPFLPYISSIILFDFVYFAVKYSCLYHTWIRVVVSGQGSTSGGAIPLTKITDFFRHSE